MAEFKCDSGKVLSAAEVADMLAYDEAGVRRPARYDDVITDNTSGSGLVYRCKTTAEKKAMDEAHEAGLRASREADARIARVREEAAKGGGGGDAIATAPVDTGTALRLGAAEVTAADIGDTAGRAVVNDAGPSGGDTPTGGGGGTAGGGAAGGAEAGGGTRTRTT